MNIKKLDQDIKLLLPNLGQESRILVEFFMPIIRGITCGTRRWRRLYEGESKMFRRAEQWAVWVV